MSKPPTHSSCTPQACTSKRSAVLPEVRLGNASLVEKALDRIAKLEGPSQVHPRYHRLPRVLEDDYRVDGAILGTGMNGSVVLASSKSGVGEVAIKQLGKGGLTVNQESNVSRELEIFLRLDHPYIVRLHDVYESEQEITMVMECANGGELLEYVKQHRGLCEHEAAGLTFQMLVAVHYLHRNNIVHRDLKLENFVIFHSEGVKVLKLIDFGLSKFCQHGENLQEACGSLPYCAPEVFSRSYGIACDSWSIGVIVYALLTSRMPFAARDDLKLVQAIRKGTYPKSRLQGVSQGGQEFVAKLLNVNPEERMTCEQALQHPWIQEHAYKTMPGSMNRFLPCGCCIREFGDDFVDALSWYSRQPYFKRAIMLEMAWCLSRPQRRQLMHACYFWQLDTEKLGIAKLSEIERVLRTHFHLPQIDIAQIMAVLEDLDTNHDGQLSHTEIISTVLHSVVTPDEALMHATFRRFDPDVQGFLTVESLGKLFQHRQVELIVEQADFDGDGKLSFEDFMAYWQNASISRV